MMQDKVTIELGNVVLTRRIQVDSDIEAQAEVNELRMAGWSVDNTQPRMGSTNHEFVITAVITPHEWDGREGARNMMAKCNRCAAVFSSKDGGGRCECCKQYFCPRCDGQVDDATICKGCAVPDGTNRFKVQLWRVRQCDWQRADRQVILKDSTTASDYADVMEREFGITWIIEQLNKRVT